MGWQECHLHDFRIADREYGMPDPDCGFDTLDERTFRLGGLVKPGDVIEYRYDFGDNWLHELIIDAAKKQPPMSSIQRVPPTRAPARPRIPAARAGSPTSRRYSPARPARHARRWAHGPAKTTTRSAST